MIVDLFSKRQKKKRGEIPEIYVYDDLPTPLRVQIVQIIDDAIGADTYQSSSSSQAYKLVHDILCREYGVFRLSNCNNDKPSVTDFIISCREVEKVLDVVELVFKYIYKMANGEIHHYAAVELRPHEAINELNYRLKEHGVGYQFESGEIIRLDSTFMHSEVVKPSLVLLSNKKFNGANEEYLKAHEHYRHGRNKECLSECGKAFESTLKIICKEKGWAYEEKDTAKKLIQICFDNGLVPSYMQTQLTSFRQLLESGVPTLRNNLGGHGQGANAIVVNASVARYGLNLAGSNILFFVEQSGIK